MFQCDLLSLRIARRLQSDAIYWDYFTCCSRRPVGGADEASKTKARNLPVWPSFASPSEAATVRRDLSGLFHLRRANPQLSRRGPHERDCRGHNSIFARSFLRSARRDRKTGVAIVVLVSFRTPQPWPETV